MSKKLIKDISLISLATLTALSGIDATNLSSVSAHRRHVRIKRVIHRHHHRHTSKSNNQNNSSDSNQNNDNDDSLDNSSNISSEGHIQIIKDLGNNPNQTLEEPESTNDTSNADTNNNKPKVIKIKKHLVKPKHEKYTGSKRFVLARIDYHIYRKNTPDSIWKKWYAVLPINSRVAKEYVGWNESRSRWNVESRSIQPGLGHPVGRYQVSQGYFPRYARHHINKIYRNKNLQEKIATKYMKRTRGSWISAAKFWARHHWW